MSAAFQYNSDLFRSSTAADWAERFRMLLEGILSNPGGRVSELSLLSEGERRFFLVDWNRTEMEYPKDRCVQELIEGRVAESPEACALEWRGGAMSYFELNRMANRLAWRLKELGIGPERLVGIYLPRSPEMMIGILAVLKAGGAYLPLDPEYPEERLALMLEDAHAEVVLSTRSLGPKLPTSGRAILPLDDPTLFETGNDAAPPCEAKAENLAYVIYTSGSTGRPKGVMITHRNLMNYLWWCRSAYPLQEGSGAPLHSPIRYDLTVTTLFAPLLSGGRIVLVPERRGVDDLAAVIAEGRDFSFVKVTPAHLKALGAILPKAEASNQTRCLVVGGEALHSDSLAYWREHAPGTLIVNEYGPTEATVGCCVYSLRAGAEISGPVPIGRPIANTRLYVLDVHGQPVPPGVPGELHIGGDSVARGYLNRPDLTAERFVPDPFNRDAGARLYRTGDLVRFRADGELEYLGRSDHQVKVAGQRIELGELETILGGHPEVRDALVAAVETAPGDRRLVAYVVPKSWVDGPSPAELRAFLRQKLPETMLPAFYVTLPGFPLAANGKVDRKALPIPDQGRGGADTAYVAPRNEIERALEEIWSRVLGIEPIGVQDNFFDLGGASIQSLAVASQASEAGIPLTAEMIFQHPTIAELATASRVASLDAHRETPALPKPSTRQVEATGTRQAARPGSRVSTGRTAIESLGVYLPARKVATGDLLRGCRNPIDFPLEKMTGIRSRRVVSEGEYSIDLAEQAARDCLLRSRRSPEEIDLLICCNISRQDGPRQFSFEPTTSVRLKKRLGLPNAVAFDISNACAGMFTGILIADWLLAAGAMSAVLVVSGEYISHLAETAQKEISGFLDPRLACLTVGDAGAAVILERNEREDIGFADLDLYTLGKYSDLCVAKATEEAHGGAIMYTDSIRQTAVALKLSVAHSAKVLRRSGWSAEEIGHVIMHQTSETALRDAMREINALYGAKVCHDGNTVINLAERGNTASTSHFVALADRMRAGEVRNGDRVVFGITGSGQTIGSSLYVMDDFPARFLESGNGTPSGKRAAASVERATRVFSTTGAGSAEILAVGLAREPKDSPGDAVELAVEAAESALISAGLDRNRADLVIHSGVYRNDFLCEPAIASIVAGRLGINHEEGSAPGQSTFAFDLLCGGLGFLSACYAATQAIRSGRGKHVLITASEIENNAGVFPERLRGVVETGSAVLLAPATEKRGGFRAFAFRDFPDYADLLVAHTGLEAGKTYLHFEESPSYPARLRESICIVVKDLLDHEGLTPYEIRVVLPPLVSETFVSELAADLKVDRDRMIGQPTPGKDGFTSSLARGLDEVRRKGLAGSGEIGLFIGAGAGIQVGCAL
ncbi:MAG: amino acid adenylation domain-containing protein, partial [Candidatus Omnitrophica bacterium]|nr:amino acid adenylation domain-containing protein [Candidatus Omnitrophota bacterium]